MTTTPTTKQMVIDHLKEKYNEKDIQQEISEAMPDYLHDEWEEDFEDEYSAYLETGNGEAENQVRQEISSEVLKHFNFSSSESYKKMIGEEVWDTVNEVFEPLNN